MGGARALGADCLQRCPAPSGNSDRESGGDEAVVDDVRLATDRSAAQRDVVTLPNGERMRRVSLGNGYNHVLIGRVGPDGKPSVTCVDSAPAAESFLAAQPRRGAASEGTRGSLSARRWSSSPRWPTASATVVIVNADAPDAGFNDPTPVTPVGGNSRDDARGAQRLAVFQKAAEIWGQALDSTVPITVLSHFEPLTCDSTGATLGSAGADQHLRQRRPHARRRRPASDLSEAATPGTSRP